MNTIESKVSPTTATLTYHGDKQARVEDGRGRVHRAKLGQRIAAADAQETNGSEDALAGHLTVAVLHAVQVQHCGEVIGYT